MRTHRRGLVLGVAAYLLWGLFPLYWPLLRPANPLEILAHRILWSLVVVGGFLLARRRLGRLRSLPRAAVARLAVAGVVVAVNWGTYIYGVNSGQVVQTSLGYFINPLVTITLGVVVLRERLRPVQWAAVGLGAAAVVVIAVDYGRPPWLALVLAVSFGSYGLLKKRAGVGVAEGLVVEAAVVALPAALALAVLSAQGATTWTGHGTVHPLLLATGGVVTAVPLLLFAGAASRLPLATLGLLQYLAPVLQLAVGVGLRHEPLPPQRLLGFVLVWLALLTLTLDALRHRGGRVATTTAEPAQLLGALPRGSLSAPGRDA